MVQVKTFTAETISDLESIVNTFLSTLDPKDVLDVIYDAFSSSKYGTKTTFTVIVIYKV